MKRSRLKSGDSVPYFTGTWLCIILAARTACDMATCWPHTPFVTLKGLWLPEAQVTQPRDALVDVGTDGWDAFYLCSFSLIVEAQICRETSLGNTLRRCNKTLLGLCVFCLFSSLWGEKHIRVNHFSFRLLSCSILLLSLGFRTYRSYSLNTI